MWVTISTGRIVASYSSRSRIAARGRRAGPPRRPQNITCCVTTHYVVISTAMTPTRARANDPTLLILTSLASGDKHGYALLQDIERFAGVTLGPGTLYGAIARLEQRGLIEPVEEPGRRRPYRLAAEG